MEGECGAAVLVGRRELAENDERAVLWQSAAVVVGRFTGEWRESVGPPYLLVYIYIYIYTQGYTK